MFRDNIDQEKKKDKSIMSGLHEQFSFLKSRNQVLNTFRKVGHFAKTPRMQSASPMARPKLKPIPI